MNRSHILTEQKAEVRQPSGLLPSIAPAGARRDWEWLGALLVLATVLRIVALNQQLWYDEIAVVVLAVRRPFSAVFTVYTSQNQHTLYSVLARICVAVFGEQSWTLRLPAVAFGVASVPALFFFARHLASRREALLASALMAVSYHHVWFSQNARGYTALLFFTLVSSYCFLRGLVEDSLRVWLAYGLTLALGMYTHLTMGFVAVGHALVCAWLLGSQGHKSAHWLSCVTKPAVGLGVGGLLTLFLYAPLLPQLLARTVVQAGTSVRWQWKNPLWMMRETLRGLEAGAGGMALAIVFAGVVALLGLGSYWKRNRYALGLMVLPCAVTGVVMFALEHNLWPRFFFFAIGFAFLLLVRGAMISGDVVARLAGRNAAVGEKWGTALILLMLMASATTLPAVYRYPKQDFVGAMRLVDDARRPGEPVLTVGLTSFAYQRYFGRDWQTVETYAQLESVRAQGSPVWFVYASPIYLQARYPEIWSAIQAEFRTVGVFRGTLGGGEIYVAEAAARPAAPTATR